MPSKVEKKTPSTGPDAAVCLQGKFAQLKREKKTLQIQLNKFNSDFVAKHGKPPRSSDRQPLKAEFTRYKDLKTQLKLMEEHETVLFCASDVESAV